MRIIENNKGLTLIEVMVTTVVFAVGVIGIITLQLNSVRANTQTRHRDEANRLLAAQVERVGLCAYGDLVNNDGGGGTAEQYALWEGDPFGDAQGVAMNAAASLYALNRFVLQDAPAETKTVYFCVRWTSVNEEKRIIRSVVKAPDREG